MDWGLGNPNKTAALIATLMVGLWILAYIRRWGFWAALVGFAALGVCLVHTFSRGGLVALFFGLVPVLLMAPRPWPWKRIIGVVTAIWVIVGFSVYLQAYERLGQGVVQEDRSITNRLELWKSAPAMMLDAPGGWGLGNSGKAFMEWYQPLDHNEPYRTMVNSHLTWLVEFGWIGRFLYLTGWLAVFMICLPDARSRWLAVPFGVWLAFLVSAIFSSVAEERWVWVVPGLALLAATAWRIKTGIWPKPAGWLIPPIVAILALLLVLIFGRGSEIQRVKSAVVIGKGTPTIWVATDEKVLGARPGRMLRTFKQELDGACLGIVADLKELPDVSGTTVILAGRFSSDPSDTVRKLADATSVLLVNPAIFPEEVGEMGKLNGKLTVVIGGFAQTPAARSWEADFQTQRLAGVGDFVPDWPVTLLQKIKTP